jgi:hypothetical protein
VLFWVCLDDSEVSPAAVIMVIINIDVPTDLSGSLHTDSSILGQDSNISEEDNTHKDRENTSQDLESRIRMMIAPRNVHRNKR